MAKLVTLLALAALALFWWRGRAARRGSTRIAGAKRGAGDAGVAGVAEARQLLGVAGDADAAAIRAAHRRLMARVHPDAGGSAALANQVNAARDLLLREIERSGNN
ncbi:J domain-containing protein [Sphingomonas changnyeongensis]|uniref:J domain-containing protein n=1 Tax=Sphingomonas changnyeongensis TaxID=2698679 RepID=A0A7Z2S4W0_9SPHN|nr:J domain-containing protein [Sphingomonas changnyeongensis]QHL89698.1 J domain-containing protein [Sphingomonas changnyeongensis]